MAGNGRGTARARRRPAMPATRPAPPLAEVLAQRMQALFSPAARRTTPRLASLLGTRKARR
jgi:hypothetical protein